MDAAFLPEHVTDHPGQHHEEHRRDLEKPGEERAVLAVLDAVRGQHALHVRLVGAPVPDAQDRISQQDRQPREAVQVPIGVEDRLQHVHLAGKGRRLEPGEIMHAHARQRAQSEHRDQRRASEQQADLHVFGHHDRLESAQDRVDHREEREHEDGPDHRHAQEALEDLRRREQADADVDQKRPQQADDRQERPGRRAIPPFHELRQRLHRRVDVERREDQRQQDEREARHPLEVADDHPVLRAARGEADQMDRRDVRGEHRRADGEPIQRMAGEKVLLAAGVLAVADPDAESGDADEVDSDDEDVDGRNGHKAGEAQFLPAPSAPVIRPLFHVPLCSVSRDVIPQDHRARSAGVTRGSSGGGEGGRIMECSGRTRNDPFASESVPFCGRLAEPLAARALDAWISDRGKEPDGGQSIGRVARPVNAAILHAFTLEIRRDPCTARLVV